MDQKRRPGLYSIKAVGPKADGAGPFQLNADVCV